MKKRTIILYDLKTKTQTEKVKALGMLYGYLDKSNYEYQYKRIGGLSKIQFKKYRKMVIELKDDKNLPKVLELLNKLKIKAEVAII